MNWISIETAKPKCNRHFYYKTQFGRVLKHTRKLWGWEFNAYYMTHWQYATPENEAILDKLVLDSLNKPIPQCAV